MMRFRLRRKGMSTIMNFVVKRFDDPIMSKITAFGQIAAVAVSALCSFPAFAANYYVTPDGDDTNDGKSWATAMRSPELLAEKYTTGAVMINVSNGVYRLTKPIVLAYTEGKSGVVSVSGDPSDVVFDCGGVTNCILTKGYSNTFRGLTICNALYDSGSYGGAGLDAHREWITVRIASSATAGASPRTRTSRAVRSTSATDRPFPTCWSSTAAS